jgi:hypothetical protein
MNTTKGKKVKLFLCLTKHHAMKTYWGVEVYLHAFFELDTRWRCMVSCTPWPLYPQGKSPWYPLYRRLDGPQIRSGHGGEEKNSQPPPGIEPLNPDRPARSLVTIPTELSWLNTSIILKIILIFEVSEINIC